jgi:Galactose oxidase, central domain/Kelch motif
VVALVALLGLSACGTGATRAPSPGVPAAAPGVPAPSPSSPGPSRARSSVATSPGAGPSSAAARQVTGIEARAAPFGLPHPLSREAAVSVDGAILLLGGFDGRGTLSEVLRLDPATGVVRSLGRLAASTHDAAAGLIGSTAYVFGGGAATSTDAIQAFGVPASAGSAGMGQIAGRLPGPRSDVSSVTVGSTALLIGGWDGTRILPDVLASTGTGAVTTVGRLAVPVRYGAVAAAAGAVWIFGGQGAHGDVSTIQRFDPATGRATIAGTLPVAVAGSSAVAFGSEVFVLGGDERSSATDRVWRFDPATGVVSDAGRLPRPVAYAALAVIGGDAYLLGGENSVVLDSVIRVRPVLP